MFVIYLNLLFPNPAKFVILIQIEVVLRLMEVRLLLGDLRIFSVCVQACK